MCLWCGWRMFGLFAVPAVRNNTVGTFLCMYPCGHVQEHLQGTSPRTWGGGGGWGVRGGGGPHYRLLYRMLKYSLVFLICIPKLHSHQQGERPYYFISLPTLGITRLFTFDNWSEINSMIICHWHLFHPFINHLDFSFMKSL